MFRGLEVGSTVKERCSSTLVESDSDEARR